MRSRRGNSSLRYPHAFGKRDWGVPPAQRRPVFRPMSQSRTAAAVRGEKPSKQEGHPIPLAQAARLSRRSRRERDRSDRCGRRPGRDRRRRSSRSARSASPAPAAGRGSSPVRRRAPSGAVSVQEHAVDHGDVHRPAVVVVGDVAFGRVLGVVGAQRRDRDLVRLRDRAEQADDARVDRAAVEVLFLQFVGEGQVAPVDRRDHRVGQGQRPVDGAGFALAFDLIGVAEDRVDVPLGVVVFEQARVAGRPATRSGAPGSRRSRRDPRGGCVRRRRRRPRSASTRCRPGRARRGGAVPPWTSRGRSPTPAGRPRPAPRRRAGRGRSGRRRSRRR